MAYANKWNSTDQIPSRAIASGEIGRFGALDPSDGGNSDRFSLSGRWAQTDEGGSSKANVYLIKSSLNLWNNFTYFLTDPVNGDQFHQHDDRILGGINASHIFNGRFAGLPMETEIGVQSRYDDIRLDLTTPCGGSSSRRSAATRCRRAASACSRRTRCTGPTGYGPSSAGAAISTRPRSIPFSRPPIPAAPMPSSAAPSSAWCSGRSPEPNSIINAGEGFHSNDARGVTITESPTDGSPLQPSPFLVQTRGAEVGLRTKIIPKLESSVSLFLLDSDSEILFSGDAGDTTASRPSRRYGDRVDQ